MSTGGPSFSICVPYAGEWDRLVVALVGFADVLEAFPGVELVIADGDDRLAERELPTGTTVVRGPFAEGSSPAASRNAAAAAATGDVLVFVDADIVVDRRSFGSLTRWFAAGDAVLVLGRLRFVDVSPDDVEPLRVSVAEGATERFFESRDLGAVDWRERYFRLTDDLRRERSDLFRVVTGGILAVRRDDFDRVGGFLPIETRGVEDIEFGYRCWASGLLLVPDAEAVGWHQGVPTMRGDRARAIAAERAPALARLLPVGGFRTRRLLARSAAVPFVPQFVTHRMRHDGVTTVDPTAGGDAAEPLPETRIAIVPYAHVWLDEPYRLSTTSRTALLHELDRAESGVVKAIAGDATVLVACTTRAMERCGDASHPDRRRAARAGDLLGVRWTTAGRLGLEPSGHRFGLRRAWRRVAVPAVGWIHRRASAIVRSER